MPRLCLCTSQHGPQHYWEHQSQKAFIPCSQKPTFAKGLPTSSQISILCIPTEYRKIMARPSQAGCALNRCRRQGPSSQDEKKKKLWAPSNKSAVIPHPQPQYPNQLSQVQVKPTTHLCLQVNWHYQVALKVQRSTCHRADTPHNHWVPPKLHQIPYWRTGNKNTQDPCLPGQY